MSRCEGELCANWTGMGCACEFLDLEREVWHEACGSIHAEGECPWVEGVDQ